MIRWINNLKGFGILLVVLGHIISREGFGQWIYAFHIPLFFYLSGYLFSIRPATRWGGINSHLRRLMLPFYFWSSICLIVSFAIASVYYPEYLPGLKTNIAHVALGSGKNGIKELGLSFFPIWFIPPLFFSNILFINSNKYMNRGVCIATMLLLALTGFVLFHIGRTLPFRIDVTLVAIPFVWAGYYHQRLVKIIQLQSAWFGLVLILTGTVINWLNLTYSSTESVEMVLQIIGNPFLFLISATLLCAGSFVLFEYIIKESTLGEFFGLNSMVVMTFHYPLIFWVRRLTGLDVISVFMVVCGILFVLIFAINRWMPWSFNFKLLNSNLK